MDPVNQGNSGQQPSQTDNQPGSFKGAANAARNAWKTGAEWKKVLSGALDEKRLFLGLIVLRIFYIIYINSNAHFDNKDEDTIGLNCSCPTSHRHFYITLSVICWFCGHVFTLFLLFLSSKHTFV